jgi:hypothetical protein
MAEQCYSEKVSFRLNPTHHVATSFPGFSSCGRKTIVGAGHVSHMQILRDKWNAFVRNFNVYVIF